MVAPKRRFFVPVLPAVGLAAVAAGPVLQALGSSGPANSVSASLATTHGSGDDGPEAGAPAGHGTPPSKGDDGHGRTIRTVGPQALLPQEGLCRSSPLTIRADLQET